MKSIASSHLILTNLRGRDFHCFHFSDEEEVELETLSDVPKVTSKI